MKGVYSPRFRYTECLNHPLKSSYCDRCKKEGKLSPIKIVFYFFLLFCLSLLYLYYGK